MELNHNGYRSLNTKWNLLSLLLLLQLFFLPSISHAENLLFQHGKYSNQWDFNLIDIGSVIYSKFDLDKDSSLCLKTRWDPVQMGCVVLSRHRAIDSKISISIRYKTQYCSKVNLIITRNNGDRRILKDTIRLKPSTEWTSAKRSIKVHEPQLLNISIKLEKMKGHWGALWLNDISIPDEALTTADSVQIDSSFSSLKNNITCWSDSDWNQFSFMKKPILGIGETCHGTQEMQDIAISIMKERILKNNCQLICKEWPIERTLYANRFIHGDSNFQLEDFLKGFDYFVESESSISSFLKWLKSYNSSHYKKVSLCGLDFEIHRFQSFFDLHKFFECLNKERNIPGVDSICQSLSSPKTSVKKIVSQITRNKNLDSILNPEEKKVIIQSLKLTDYSDDYIKRFAYRDHAFYDNFTIESDSLLKAGGTVTLGAHFGHLNYVDRMYYTSLKNDFDAGYYLKNNYKNNYSCVGLIALKGTTIYIDTPHDSINPIEVEIPKASPFSLESELGKLSLDSLYLSTENMNGAFYSFCRSIGYLFCPEVDRLDFPIVPKSRADGFIYLRQVHAIKKEKTKREFEMEVSDYMKRAENKKHIF